MSMLNNDDLFAGFDNKIVGASEALSMDRDDPQNVSTELPTEVEQDGDVVPLPQTIRARCPIIIMSETIDGVTKKIIHASIRGPIDDLDGYVPLIDTLNRATSDFIFKIHIQSGGGMVTTGATIASAIADCKGHVITIAEGLCASAASLIWSAGHECIVGNYAMFMYHMSSHADMGNSLYIKENAEKMTRYVEHCLMRNALANGHITPDQKIVFCENKDEVWISAKQMREQMLAVAEAMANKETPTATGVTENENNEAGTESLNPGDIV